MNGKKKKINIFFNVNTLKIVGEYRYTVIVHIWIIKKFKKFKNFVIKLKSIFETNYIYFDTKFLGDSIDYRVVRC